MNGIIARLALALSLMLASTAYAQSGGTIQPAAPAAQGGVPAVESIDILNQNQAERNRDQPGNLSPTWRQVKSGTPNSSSFPYPESSILIQPKAQFPGQARATTAGEAWRQYRNGPLTFYGGWLLILTVIGLAAIYLVFGQIKQTAPSSGRLIERFTPIERITHWTMAITFVLLAVTGLLMLFGKHVVLPVLGHTVFGWITYVGKNIHNFVGPVFTLSVIVFFFIVLRDNLPQRGDLKWLVRLGGLFGKDHVPSGRFNAGEKLWFWGGMMVLGMVLTASGFFLDELVPGVEYTRGNMQVANIVHIVGGVLMMALSLGHIYLGTIGMQGAYDGMRHGYVDDTWAQQHHQYWYEDVQSGKVPRIRSAEGKAEVGSSTVGAPSSAS